MGRNAGVVPVIMVSFLMGFGSTFHIIGFAINDWSEYSADVFSGSFGHGLWNMCQRGSSDSGCITIPNEVVVAKFNAVRALESIALILYIFLWAPGFGFVLHKQETHAWLYTIFGSLIAASISLIGIIIYGTDYGMLFPEGYVYEHHKFGWSIWLCISGAILYLLSIVNVIIVIALIKWKDWEFEDEDNPDYVPRQPSSGIPTVTSVSSQNNPVFTNVDHVEMPDESITQSDF